MFIILCLFGCVGGICIAISRKGFIESVSGVIGFRNGLVISDLSYCLGFCFGGGIIEGYIGLFV